MQKLNDLLSLFFVIADKLHPPMRRSMEAPPSRCPLRSWSSVAVRRTRCDRCPRPPIIRHVSEYDFRDGREGLYLLKSACRWGGGTSWATLNVCWLFTAHKQISVQPAQQQPPTGAGHANALSLQPKLVELSTKRGKRKYACPMWHHQSVPRECLLCGLCQ